MSFMVFKAPGSNLIHGVMVDFKVIDESEIDEHLSNGWSRFAIEADQALAASQQAAADQKA
ncbi:MAG: hypothetical protein JO171_13045, partial [Paludibacterium sp.]|uniref:hypothetical protein n=1 Tax=Paludibacterium sp. TaxID=1917523 RepID=UPI0025F21C6E